MHRGRLLPGERRRTPRPGALALRPIPAAGPIGSLSSSPRPSILAHHPPSPVGSSSSSRAAEDPAPADAARWTDLDVICDQLGIPGHEPDHRRGPARWRQVHPPPFRLRGDTRWSRRSSPEQKMMDPRRNPFYATRRPPTSCWSTRAAWSAASRRSTTSCTNQGPEREDGLLGLLRVRTTGVSGAALDAAADWLRKRGLTACFGPVNRRSTTPAASWSKASNGRPSSS
jgi:hypothetical protein